jgi:hypothetical protein
VNIRAFLAFVQDRREMRAGFGINKLRIDAHPVLPALVGDVLSRL